MKLDCWLDIFWTRPMSSTPCHPNCWPLNMSRTCTWTCAAAQWTDSTSCPPRDGSTGWGAAQRASYTAPCYTFATPDCSRSRSCCRTVAVSSESRRRSFWCRPPRRPSLSTGCYWQDSRTDSACPECTPLPPGRVRCTRVHWTWARGLCKCGTESLWPAACSIPVHMSNRSSVPDRPYRRTKQTTLSNHHSLGNSIFQSRSFRHSFCLHCVAQASHMSAHDIYIVRHFWTCSLSKGPIQKSLHQPVDQSWDTR